MALISNSWTVFFLFPVIVSSLSFNFSSFGPGDQNVNIKVQGDAYISPEGIQVTTDESSKLSSRGTGHATYVKPFYLWNNSSGNVSDFDTNFSFVVQSDNTVCSADGFAFFLSPLNWSIPLNSSGKGLGLSNNVTTNASAAGGDPFFAVEFDTFSNRNWDPPAPSQRTPHVGIDINSVISANTVLWPVNITDGDRNDVRIRYDSLTRNLSVVFTVYKGNNRNQSRLEDEVDLRYLPEWVSVGFSAATGACFEKHNVKSWSFNSNGLDLDDENPSINPEGKKTKAKAGLVIGLVAGLSVFVLAVILLVICLRRKKSEKGNEEEFVFDVSMENEFERGSGPKKFSYAELVRATDNFSEEHKLGEGGFGGVYLGFLKDSNSDVAVKRVSKSSKQGAKEYASEVRIISRLRHRNLVQLIGWCHEKRELLLVYEFLPNGSLDSHLFEDKSSLSWETRYKVAQGLASALLYLHEEWEQCVIHRDIKSSNVMLDSSFNAKLGDFGLARLVDHEAESQTTVLAGTMGYMAPECVITGKASKESDVYSFGIVALEIACGRKPIDGRAQGSQVRLVEWVWELYGRGVHLEAGDPKLGEEYNEEEMERLMVVGLWCAHPDHTLRPSIRQAIQVLSSEAQPPVLPSKLPVPTYLAPAPYSVSSLLSESSLTGNNQTRSSNFSYNSNTSNITSSSAASSSSTTSLLNST
ncbi:hypothetical protein ACS0TY_002884 [Phlomoides rotata]